MRNVEQVLGSADERERERRFIKVMGTDPVYSHSGEGASENAHNSQLQQQITPSSVHSIVSSCKEWVIFYIRQCLP